MPSETLQGIVLRVANYRDRDRMLTLLTPDKGRVDVLSRGCRRPKSCLMSASENFVQGEFVVFRNQDRYTLTSCNIAESYYPVRLDAYRMTCGAYMLQLAQAAAHPEQEAETLYELLTASLHSLCYDQDASPLMIVNSFLLLFAADNGYRPRLNHCVYCQKEIAPTQSAYFDSIEGGICCRGCAKGALMRLSADQLQWMRQTLKQGLGVPEIAEDKTLFEVLRRYVESRLEATIKSSKFLP
ncbi:MAG TPA: DNA repair protein RecO [Candidatus Limiplasma sp.]|nr:DNA repair protein RecO [Candidatus Limiplasma sp.]